ncbi:pirin family protein [Paludibacterium paludis]|uniref:Pirin family protein n=1 Tax=Paludibacterium paludis TaxID=1225769 RepID=A0A918P795_9NEIS|nr:pirin family protein [Paludibacterium paludis]GGY29856.1 hypothetical protein GCM10011289_35940 [Paludibacterium paludis]
MSPALAKRIAGVTRDVGFAVKRLLPAGEARSIGPFVFLDHMGPARFAAGTAEGDVRQHPHIGLATVTYLFSGALMHRDSLGTEQRIEPGAVNWMSAGRGISHSERIPADIRQTADALHGIQMWIALPTGLEESEPVFRHYPTSDIPVASAEGASIAVLIGTFRELASPVPSPWDMLYAALTLEDGASFTWPAGLAERAVYVAEGSVRIDNETIPAGHLAVLNDTDATLSATAASRVMLLGGEPLDGPRHMWWNFVSRRKARIEAAREDWEAGRIPRVPGENDFIPAPPLKRLR